MVASLTVSCPGVITLVRALVRAVLAFEGAEIIQLMITRVRTAMRLSMLASAMAVLRRRMHTLFVVTGMGTVAAID